MSASKNTVRLLGAAALAGLVFHTAPAAAQMSQFCQGSILETGFYFKVKSASSGADVEYYGQFQNRDTKGRILHATIIPIDNIIGFTVQKLVGRFDLKLYQEVNINLLTIHTANPAGSGAPSSSQVREKILVVCTYSAN